MLRRAGAKHKRTGELNGEKTKKEGPESWTKNEKKKARCRKDRRMGNRKAGRGPWHGPGPTMGN